MNTYHKDNKSVYYIHKYLFTKMIERIIRRNKSVEEALKRTDKILLFRQLRIRVEKSGVEEDNKGADKL